LCPRYYTIGPSRCPGCCGPDFFNKHPSCSFITCCVKKKKLEICAECSEFPCKKFKDAGKYDSFLTYRKVMPNLGFIKEHGIRKFITKQEKRIKLLEILLKYFDDGRSKSFYCIAATILPIKSIEKSLNEVEQSDDNKTRARALKKSLNKIAVKEGIELKLRKK